MLKNLDRFQHWITRQIQWDNHRSIRTELHNELNIVGEYSIKVVPNNKFVLIHNLYVYPEYRKSGYGNQLLADAVSKATDLVFADKTIWLQIYGEHPFTRQWYERNGFTMHDEDEEYPYMYKQL